MFDRIETSLTGPEWADEEPMPGSVGYESFQVFQAQQDAFWSAYAAREISADGAFPDLSGMRTDEGLLRELADAAKDEARLAGKKLRAISNYALRQIANPQVGYDAEQMLHSTQAEVGLRLGVTPETASGWLDLSLALTRRLPETFAALEDGAISLAAARAIAEESVNLDVARCARFEKTVLAKSAGRTAGSLRRIARREVEKLDADAVRKRKEKAAAERALYLRDEGDGMSTLCVYLPNEQAQACFDAIDALVHPKAVGDLRPVAARRADALVDLIGAATGIDPRMVPVPESSFLTPEQIEHLNRGADTYVPSPAMKRAIRARDKHCRFPGCRRPAVRSDVDHTLAFFKAGGRTVYANLACLCRFHHQIKQLPGWSCTQDHQGTLTWTTPHGDVFTTRPPPDEGEEPPDICPAPAPDEDIPPF